MTLEQLNSADPALAHAAFLRCCSSDRWADLLVSHRPFGGPAALLERANSLWWTLEESDWLQAFAAHPRIGEKSNAPRSHWSSHEQNGVNDAPAAVQAAMAKRNDEYMARFGWVFLINATGKGAAEMLQSLETRLNHGRHEELRIAAAEQAKITELRIRKLLEE